MHALHVGHSASLDRKTMERVIQKLDGLSRLNGVPQLQRSHPYLPDITRDIKDHLRQIVDKTSDLSHNQYLQVTVKSLLSKTVQCAEIVKKEGAVARRNLTKLSLIFSHILSELRALFPGGRFQGNSYRITKLEASKFWVETFGKRCLVRWEEFRDRLHSMHPIGDGPLESALRSTMDLTCNDYISVFEFDIFSRLFQPWETLLQNWMLLAVTHPGYMAFLTYDEVKEILQGHIHKPGSYIFRLSCTHLGQWAIGYVTSGGNILQTIPHNKSLYEALKEGERECLYLYPNGLSSNPDLLALANPTLNTLIQVTPEQWELYSDMDSTFELCKICADKEKNTQIHPCGHLLCDTCLTAWQKSDNTCPFCRTKITGREEVHIAASSEVELPSSLPNTAEQSDNDQNAASNIWHGFTENVHEEEADWIRNRPLPPPPPNAPSVSAHHSSTRALPSTPTPDSLPSTSRTSSVPWAARFSLPSQRVQLRALDVINRGTNSCRPPITRRT
ncbi:E3 ubiquitin-protein ligase CBL-C isoform X1 [Bufo bufo]|uniref:E3 ubiquitin-protein ligase CBL-C isoform X1 n=1 Tax=Bufo bufo TaxID=8384 RepID=UPI001ABEC9AF|nr:E3 ubiquitin-protein ligase CBL-C isoform X1 [Bufo bufo]